MGEPGNKRLEGGDTPEEEKTGIEFQGPEPKVIEKVDLGPTHESDRYSYRFNGQEYADFEMIPLEGDGYYEVVGDEVLVSEMMFKVEEGKLIRPGNIDDVQKMQLEELENRRERAAEEAWKKAAELLEVDADSAIIKKVSDLPPGMDTVLEVEGGRKIKVSLNEQGVYTVEKMDD